MQKIFICSPYRGAPEKNIKNVKRYCEKAADKGYIPIAPHLYFTQFLNDDNPIDRSHGLWMGRQLLEECAEVWVYANEVTEGMISEMVRARELGIKMRFFNEDMEELDDVKYLLHKEIGAAYGRFISNYFGYSECFEGSQSGCDRSTECCGRNEGAYGNKNRRYCCHEHYIKHRFYSGESA